MNKLFVITLLLTCVGETGIAGISPIRFPEEGVAKNGLIAICLSGESPRLTREAVRSLGEGSLPYNKETELHAEFFDPELHEEWIFTDKQKAYSGMSWSYNVDSAGAVRFDSVPFFSICRITVLINNDFSVEITATAQYETKEMFSGKEGKAYADGERTFVHHRSFIPGQ